MTKEQYDIACNEIENILTRIDKLQDVVDYLTAQVEKYDKDHNTFIHEL